LKSAVIAIIVIVILGALGYFFFAKDQYKTNEPAATTQNKQATPSTSKSTDREKPKETTSEDKVTYTDSGFSPQSLTVKGGTEVTFVNSSSETVDVESNPHPSHTDNSQLNVGTINPGGSAKATLTTSGIWGYHNHPNGAEGGTIVVE